MRPGLGSFEPIDSLVFLRTSSYTVVQGCYEAFAGSAENVLLNGPEFQR